MDKNRLEELYNRALDGCLSPEDEREFAVHLKDHPEVLAELESFGEIQKQLRENVPAEVEPPYPEFFNVHLERLIREERVAATTAGESRTGRSNWVSWLLPAAAAAALAFFAGAHLGGPAQPAQAPLASVLPVVYSPITSVHPEAMVDSGTGGTVIILEGLSAIPDSVELTRTTARLDEENSAPGGEVY